MLIISGTAQFTEKSNNYVQGNIHNFTLFVNKGSFEDNLPLIEKHLNDLGWDDIFLDETEVIESKTDLKHKVLIEGYDKAVDQDISVVVNNIALEKID